MGSNGHVQPHLWRPLPGPAMMPTDPFIPGVRPLPGPFFDILPPSEIMEQKLAAQHVEMERLANENQKIAATHVALRQELAAAQQELQRLQTQMGVMKAEKDQQMKGLIDKIAKMEVELQASETFKMELQQARTEAQNLVAVRQDLISKIQQLTQELQRNHVDVQQLPAMMSEMERVRREYHDCRMTYDYEKKLYSDHLESLQVMEKNYISMSREVEKLRSELAKSTNVDRSGGHYGENTAYQENDTPGHNASAQNTSAKLSVGQNTYEEDYNIPQGRVPPGSAAMYVGGPGGAASTRMGHEASRGTGYEVPRAANYDAYGGGSYDSSRGTTGYDVSRGAGAGYDAPRGAGAGYGTSRGATAGYDSSRGAGYDASTVSAYDASRGVALGYDAMGAAGYEAPRGAGYDAPRGPGGAQSAAAQANKAAYGST